MKIAVITCYFMPDYVRARTLRAALTQLPGVKLIIIKNSHTGLLRYPEILWKIWQVKRRQKPDAYLLTFRGQEILPFVLTLAGAKPLLFDEFIVPSAYLSEQHQKSAAIRIKYFLIRVSAPFYRHWLSRCRAILTDTQSHAELSARLNHLNLSTYHVVPVGTDEGLFKPAPVRKESDIFRVFYYTTGMQPLHGIPVVLEAAGILKAHKDIEFFMVGGKKPMQKAVRRATDNGAQVHYERWIAFEDLVATIQDAGLCLGGPFGDTQQAHHVVTGKTYQFLACGVPVVVGASEATAEYFVDKQNTLVVPQGDAASLAKAVLWAKSHPAEIRGIADEGRTLYEKRFSTAAIAKLLEPLVSDL
jgi:glycosyltransferase involved in cell wall biosynthesis